MKEKLVEQHNEFLKHKEARKDLAREAGQSIVDALADKQAIKHNLENAIGNTLYKIVPKWNAKKQVDNDTKPKLCVGKKPAMMVDSGYYGSKARVGYLHQDQVFWFLQEAHTKLVARKDKTTVLEDFWKLIYAIRDKESSTGVFEIPVSIKVPTVNISRWDLKDNIYKDDKQVSLHVPSPHEDIFIDKVVLNLPRMSSSKPNHYSASDYAQGSSSPDSLNIKITPMCFGRKGETISITKKKVDTGKLYEEERYGHQGNALGYAIDDYASIINHPDVQSKIDSYLEWQRTATKAYKFMMHRYSKELFAFEL